MKDDINIWLFLSLKQYFRKTTLFRMRCRIKVSSDNLFIKAVCYRFDPVNTYYEK